VRSLRRLKSAKTPSVREPKSGRTLAITEEFALPTTERTPVGRGAAANETVGRGAAANETDGMTEFDVPVPSSMPAPSAPVVVVVDDEPVLRATLVRALGDLYTVYEAADGLEAQALLRVIDAPHALVCDVSLPGIDGIQLVKGLRKDPRTSRVPVLFLSGRRSAADVVRGINAGARHYVTKPFDLADLISKIGAMTTKKVS
jgi:CheY-like chemotaxis protein